jgi:hypothetical protein
LLLQTHSWEKLKLNTRNNEHAAAAAADHLPLILENRFPRYLRSFCASGFGIIFRPFLIFKYQTRMAWNEGGSKENKSI